MTQIHAHVFVVDLDRPALSDVDRHHLERVLRLRVGDLLAVSDGAGGMRTCRFGPELVPYGEVEWHPRPQPAITIAFALPKGDRPEDVVRKLTEVGIDRIVPMVSARSVVRWDPPRAARNVERLRRVAREAAMQSRRVWLPVVDDVRLFAAAAAERGAVLADRDGQPPSLESTVVLIGPEGGWSDEERSVGLPCMRLAEPVLRAETAAVAAGVLLGALRARLVSPATSGQSFCESQLGGSGGGGTRKT